MISSAFQCGCPERGNQAPYLIPHSVNLNSCTSLAEIESGEHHHDDTCGCGSDAGEEMQEKSRVLSEIAAKGLPYKEIEAVINNNRVVVRLQTEKPSKFDPPCECIEPQVVKSETANSISKGGNEIVFQKTKEHCRTINVYPHPDPKTTESGKGDKLDKKDSKKTADQGANINFPTVNPEENPNIFVLKIKRKCENGDKKHNFDLEFRAPRPWRQQPK
ncbi:uncharacterized protein LOC131670723 [Phymastichus coffea]|uniref:uncharacterized protein LOC131670723 n=1 Tax=Phymastichus coffea TaxID=108790 RepID=UPI00273BF0C6|nr:uncharacterized protein LOC131670723 [Phymastichus coffea]